MRSLLLRTAVAGLIAASGFGASFTVSNAAVIASTASIEAIGQPPAQQGPIVQSGSAIPSAALLMECALFSPSNSPSNSGQTATNQPAGCLPVTASEMPFDAPTADSDSVVLGIVPSGESAWLRVGYPGGGQALGLTLQLPAPFAAQNVGPTQDNGRANLPVDVSVNQRTEKDVTLGDQNADWPGLTRLGFLTRTDNTGTDRVFWTNSQGGAITYYVKVFNHSKQDVPIALAFEVRDVGGINQTTINPLPLGAFLSIAQSISDFSSSSQPDSE